MKKTKWDIPEYLEREHLRPMAEDMAAAYKYKFGEDNVTIEVEADIDRENPRDLIKITITDPIQPLDYVDIEIEILPEDYERDEE